MARHASDQCQSDPHTDTFTLNPPVLAGIQVLKKRNKVETDADLPEDTRTFLNEMGRGDYDGQLEVRTGPRIHTPHI